MTKQNFIALANFLRNSPTAFTDMQLDVLADFCKSQNGALMREWWMGYIRGECGPNGGTPKRKLQTVK